MEPIRLEMGVSLDEMKVTALVRMVRRILRAEDGADDRNAARRQASQHALFGGQKPPEEHGLLVNTSQVAKLLKVSPRTVWQMQNSGTMPKAIRIGRAVRWGYEEIKRWVDAGCPNMDGWEKRTPL